MKLRPRWLSSTSRSGSAAARARRAERPREPSASERPARTTAREHRRGLGFRRGSRRLAHTGGSASHRVSSPPTSTAAGSTPKTAGRSSDTRGALGAGPLREPDELVEALEVRLQREASLLRVLLGHRADEMAHLDLRVLVGGLEGGGERAVADRAAGQLELPGEEV